MATPDVLAYEFREPSPYLVCKPALEAIGQLRIRPVLTVCNEHVHVVWSEFDCYQCYAKLVGHHVTEALAYLAYYGFPEHLFSVFRGELQMMVTFPVAMVVTTSIHTKLPPRRWGFL
jgi:hypothetical protein